MDNFRRRVQDIDVNPSPRHTFGSSGSLNSPLPGSITVKDARPSSAVGNVGNPTRFQLFLVVCILLLFVMLPSEPSVVPNLRAEPSVSAAAVVDTNVLVVTDAVVAPSASARPKPGAGGTRGAPPVVCILGNAQTVAMARAMTAFWPTYHAFWAIWGQPAEAVVAEQLSYDHLVKIGSHGSSVPTSEAVFRPFPCKKGECPWKKGMEMALAEARASGIPCEYYFTSDDDSDWFLANDPRVQAGKTGLIPTLAKPTLGGSVQVELTHQLHVWRPAVASFGWEYGDKTFAGAAEAAKANGDAAVSLLTAFDNGNALYHASVIDFIIPFGPSGEGGFIGNWTLPASWLNMMVPFAFQGNALRVNSIVYTNKLNMNNGEATLGRKPKTFIADGVFHTEAARHPYEFPRRKPFEGFLSLGIVPLAGATKSEINGNMTYRWGPHLFPSDISWKLTPGHPPYAPADVKSQMATRFDVAHEAVGYSFKRWEAKWNGAVRFHVVQLLSSSAPDMVQRVLADMVLPVSNPLTQTSGFLAASPTHFTTATLLSIGDLPAEQAAQVNTILEDANGAIAAPFPVISIAVSSTGLNLRGLLETAWKTQDVGTFAPQEDVLVLLHQGRRVSRTSFLWMTDCINEFRRWTGVLGCALRTHDGFAHGNGKFSVRTKKPQFSAWSKPTELPSSGTVLAETQYTFIVDEPDWSDGPGIAVTKGAWTAMLARLDDPAASVCQATVAEASKFVDADDSGPTVWPAVWRVIRACLPPPTGPAGVVYASTFP